MIATFSNTKICQFCSMPMKGERCECGGHLKKKVFYVTFGQHSPFRHGYVEVQASDLQKAEEVVIDAIGDQYSNIYTPQQFKKGLFGDGQLGRVLVGK